MKHLDGMLKLIDSEFDTIEKNGKFRSRDEIEYVYKLIDIAKDIYCIWEYEKEMDDDYSEARRPYYRYNDDRSYARRNSRYSMNSYVDSLRELMQNAPDENTRQSIQRMIDGMSY